MSPGQMTMDQTYGFGHQMFDSSQLVQIIDQMIRSSLPHLGTGQQAQPDFSGTNGTCDFMMPQQMTDDIETQIMEDHLSEEYYAMLDT